MVRFVVSGVIWVMCNAVIDCNASARTLNAAHAGVGAHACAHPELRLTLRLRLLGYLERVLPPWFSLVGMAA